MTVWWLRGCLGFKGESLDNQLSFKECLAFSIHTRVRLTFVYFALVSFSSLSPPPLSLSLSLSLSPLVFLMRGKSILHFLILFHFRLLVCLSVCVCVCVCVCVSLSLSLSLSLNSIIAKETRRPILFSKSNFAFSFSPLVFVYFASLSVSI